MNVKICTLTNDEYLQIPFEYRYIRDYNRDRLLALLASGWQPRPKHQMNPKKSNKPQHRNTKPTRANRRKRRENATNQQRRRPRKERFEGVPRKYKGNEFTVVPQYSFQRQHIAVDRNVFYHLLSKIRCQHPAFRPIRGGKKKDDTELTNADWSVLWREYFHIVKLERGHAGNSPNGALIEFDEQFSTDGIAVSFNMRCTTPKKKQPPNAAEETDEERMERERLYQKQQWENCEQVVAIDVGLKLPIAGIRRSMVDNSVTNIRITHREFHNTTNARKRTRRRQLLTKTIDDRMREAREEYARNNPGMNI